jgi:hypothetical protein
MSIPQPLLRDEIPRNEAYIEVRRSASGPEGLRPGGTRDEGNAADGRFPSASLYTYTQAPFCQGQSADTTPGVTPLKAKYPFFHLYKKCPF